MEKGIYSGNSMLVALSRTIITSLKPPFVVTPQQRRIIFHLFMDIAWMGVVSGTVGSFLAVYCTRMGASNTQVGWLNAAPAMVSLFFGIPVGNWMKTRRLSQVVFWSAFAGRIFYLPLCLLPFFLLPPGQVQATIGIILMMSLPLTLLNVSFNSMFAEVIPIEQRGYVVGGRNAILAISALLFTLGSGRLLVILPQPQGYQVVFLIGFIGSMISTLHLFRIRDISISGTNSRQNLTAGIHAVHHTNQDLRNRMLWRLSDWGAGLDRRYLRVVLLLFTFHIAQWLVIPVVPLFSVNQLHLNDFQISLATSLFSLITFVVSFQVARVINKTGNRKAAGIGMIGIGLYPLILSQSTGFPMYLFAHFIGAISWSVLAVALLNYLLENTPEHDRSIYMAYYIVASNAAILFGSLVGPYIATQIGYSSALAIFAVLRLFSGIAVLLWG
jgi:MFS family permease